jgi:1,2-phenylacetyl-CoA epoxidase PaaB subunit
MGQLKEYEVKVTHHSFIGVEAYSEGIALEMARDIFTHQTNAEIGEHSTYEIIDTQEIERSTNE